MSLCTFYVDQSSDDLCNYPCSLDHCIAETHYWVDCPVWTCSDKSSTLSPIPPTTAPSNDSSSLCTTWLCIFSVSLNVMIFLVVFSLISLFLIRRRRRTHTSQNSIENPIFDFFSNERPIIRSHSESFPLLATAERSVRFLNQSETQRSEAFLSPAARAHPTNSSTSLNADAPDLPYVEVNF